MVLEAGANDAEPAVHALRTVPAMAGRATGVSGPTARARHLQEVGAACSVEDRQGLVPREHLERIDHVNARRDEGKQFVEALEKSRVCGPAIKRPGQTLVEGETEAHDAVVGEHDLPGPISCATDAPRLAKRNARLRSVDSGASHPTR